MSDADDNENEQEQEQQPKPKPKMVKEKIHLHSIDWAAFKQIRTDDIMSYFKDYGPSYVEWINELSCNVIFEDEFSSKRAMMKLSQDIPDTETALSEDDVREIIIMQKKKK